MPNESIMDKNKSYKVAFRKVSQRTIAINKLKENGFDVSEDYTRDACYLFISTFDDLRIAAWDTRIIYQEKGEWYKQISFKKLLELCKGH